MNASCCPDATDESFDDKSAELDDLFEDDEDDDEFNRLKELVSYERVVNILSSIEADVC